jgi:2-amino-4-hydroxy-6-hydroxymethyldihydropteridine diphosphokinase
LRTSPAPLEARLPLLDARAAGGAALAARKEVQALGPKVSASPEFDPKAGKAWVGIGANLGDPATAVMVAMDALETLPQTRVEARSRLWRTKPVKAPGPFFVNAVVRLRTMLSPHTLLSGLLELENQFGRERSSPNAPRTLDLDLLMVDDLSYNDEGPPALVLPHPRLCERAFVLAPLAELDPDLQLPNRERIDVTLTRLLNDPDQVIELLAYFSP